MTNSRQFSVHIIVQGDDVDISLDGLRIGHGKRSLISVTALGALMVEAMLEQLPPGGALFGDGSKPG